MRLRATAAALVAACGTLEPSSEEPGGTDAGVDVAAPPGVDASGLDAAPDASPPRVMHHLASSFDETPAPLAAFGWTASNPGTITPGLFELDTSKFRSGTRSLHIITSNTQVYLAQDLGDAAELTLQAWFNVETYSASASAAPRLFDIHCDGGYGFYVRLATIPSVRFVDGKTDSLNAYQFLENSWTAFTLTMAASNVVTYAVAGMGETITLSQKCLHPHLFIGVLPSTGESANVRFDDLDLVWSTSN